ncbi:MAG: hypothetical protein ACI97A_000647 [Planctomycetota bacterium]|jgi:hypothetical protein
MSSDSENVEKKKAPVRPSRGGAKSRQRSSRKKPQSGGPNKAIIAGVLTVVVIAGAAFALGVFDGEPKKDDGEKTKTVVVKDTPKEKSTSSNIFDSSKSSKDPNAAKKRERVSGRAPKTITDIKKTVAHLGHLYMNDDLSKRVRTLQKSVEEFKRERWDISKELKATHKKLGIEISTAKADKFLSGADDDLRSFNTFTRRTAVHLKDKEGNVLPEPFVGIAHEPFVFMVQANTSGGEKVIADEVYDWMVQLKAEFVRYFDGSIKLEPKGDSRIRIILFRNYKDYANYNRIKNPDRDITFALAHYEPDTKRLCVPLDFGTMMGAGKDKKHAFREVMFHEGTHQVMHYFTNNNHLGSYGSMWSDEGVAEYFAGHCIDPEDGKIKFGRINTRIRAVAADQNDAKFRITMTELLTWTRFKMSRARERGDDKEQIANRIHSHVYSQGWAMVYFFNNFKGGIYKPKFMEIMKMQISKGGKTGGDSGLPVWRRIFTDAEFNKIEVEYFDYLDFLSDAYRDKKIVNHTLID